MGRYCFFDTGIEHKFWFAVQPSQDIWDFGGEDKGQNSDGYFEYSWDKDDNNLNLIKLKKLAKDAGLPMIEFETYEKSVEGTHKLRGDIYEMEFPSEEEHAKFLLGATIYHQLLYCDTLHCEYEL